jgi:hypothetical protein
MSSSTASTPSNTAASTPQTHSTTNLLRYNQIDPTPANIQRFTSIIASAFHSTPLINIFVAETDADSITHALAKPPFPHARRKAQLFPGIEWAALSGAELVEAGDFSALALWESPNLAVKLSVKAQEPAGEIVTEWRDAARRLKATYVGTESDPSGSETKLRPFYHLSFLGRNPDQPSTPGAISAVVLPFLERAREENVPAWLEATSPRAVAIYQHFGFQVCEEVVIGRGKCDDRGYPCSGEQATGVSAWGMIYDSHLR